jgi:hypothetical protein
MARVDFRVRSSGVVADTIVGVGTKAVLSSQGSDIGTASGDFFNQGGVPKWHNGTATKTLAYTDSNITGTAAAWTTARTVQFAGGDVTGSFSIDGSANISNVQLTIGADSVALGTDTTGNYVATIAGTTNRITVTGSGSENAAVTLNLPQDIHTGASPTFAGMTLSGDLAVNGSDITTTASGTATVFNTNATTLNIGGAATAVSIGAGTGTTTVNNALTVTGNLTVNGTTITVNSTTVTVDDPIITLGGDTAPSSDDNKDRGIEFRWHNGTAAKVGFFGFDDSTGRFTFIPDATNSAEVFSGTLGVADFGGLFVGGIEIDPDATAPTNGQVLAYNGTKFVPTSITSGTNTFGTIAVSGQSNVEADSTTDTLTLVGGTGVTITTNASTDTITFTNSGVTSISGTTNQITASASTGAVTLSLANPINVNTTGSAATLTTSRNFSVTGAVTTASPVAFNGSGDVAISVAMANDAVTLGTHTTGNYVASLVAGTGVTITNNSGEGATPTVAIGQSVATTATPTFTGVLLKDSDTATAVLETFESTTLSTTSQTAVGTALAVASYRSAKYVVQAVQGTNYMVTEILAVHNGTSVDYVEYGTITIGTAPATFDVAVVSSNLVLRATGASSSSTVYQVRVTGMPI